MKHTFTYEKDVFLYDGQPVTLISGAVHYFRTVPEYWEDRLSKLKACGFNAVETYTCWNLHERREGQFDFSGILDIERFIETAGRLGLFVILRPGPYICAEWDFGGLPSWLMSYPDLALRCDDPAYLEKVKPYYRELLSRVRPHLCTNGGNVIMMQVENEYGSYGDDSIYLQKVVDIYRENDIDCLLFTSDGTARWMLSGGTLPDVLAVANFGSYVDQMLTLREFQKDRPLMCGEFWCGWFDHWYESGRDQRAGEDIAGEVNRFFDLGASFNFYMFHGGTNFGFWNGANHPGEYQPTITSYDYCALLTEAGDTTPLYDTVKGVIEQRTGKKAPDIKIRNSEKAAYGKLELTKQADLFANLDRISAPIKAAFPKTMEQIGQDFGYILYRTEIKGPVEPLPLCFGEIHDRAIVFVNGKRVGLKERDRVDDEIIISLDFGETATLEILVENMGRVNYGIHLLDKKGILGGVRLGQRYHFGWEMYPLTMDDLSGLVWGEQSGFEKPTFLRGNLHLDEQPKDTYIRLDGFTKGFVTVNGFNIGRYFNPAGPQKTLYVPAPLLKQGDNEIVVFESDGYTDSAISFVDVPQLK
ncbi:MAG: beta-galactosidase [Clostridia bacterium]|nr:beta-galactosidase [Clostridia bacterium]